MSSPARLPDLDHIAFGGDYSPEQWDREVWTADYEAFDAASITTLTVGVFTWALTQPDEDTFDFTVLDEPARVAEQVVGDADEQDALLRGGDARNAIVATWHRFEVQGERAGVPRRPSETSSEYALRILDLAEADTGPVRRLAELYREARFSDHEITEEHRSEALAALAGIRRSLGVRT